MRPDRSQTLRGALAGAAAAGVWAAQQPVDQRVFGVRYDDCALLGRAVTGGRAAYPVGVAWHLFNGAAFGAAYARLAPALRGPRAGRGLAAGIAEHLATWPLTRFVDRHPAGSKAFPMLWGDRRAFAQATWRHALFGVTLGALEARLNPPAAAPSSDFAIDVSPNGRGDVEHLASARS
jgi:hypothetical protein